LDGGQALDITRRKLPDVPFITVSGAVTDEQASGLLKAGAANCALKDQIWQLLAAVGSEAEKVRLRRSCRGMSRLVKAVQELSLARDLDCIQAIVRRAARELTGADGATFVLREGIGATTRMRMRSRHSGKGNVFPAILH